MPLSIDQMLGHPPQQYQILGLLGEGGMAAVYRARQLTMQREVAVKVIDAKLVRLSADFATRFEREARIIAALSQAHILKVFDYGQQDADTLYLVMELLTGGSLGDLIRRTPGHLPDAEAIRLLDQIAQALDYAHRKGVIHRDLKPQNVLLDETGSAYLTDFGIARLVDQTSGLTASGTAIGTPAYMPPEQWRGETLDNRADLYALGIIGYELLSGQVPFQGNTPFAMMHKHIYEALPPINARRPDLPLGVQAVLNKAMAKDPAERYSAARDFVNDLQQALSGAPVQINLPSNKVNAANGPFVPSPRTPTPIPTATASSSQRSNRASLLVVGALGAIIVVALLAVLLKSLPTGATVTSTFLPTTVVAALPTATQSSLLIVLSDPTPTAESSAQQSSPVAASSTASLPTIPATQTTLPTASPMSTALSIQAIAATVKAQDLTATATRWTLTPTPNITASVNAFLTQDAAQNLTATATRWTLTPTSTFMPPTRSRPPSARPFPSPTTEPPLRPRIYHASKFVPVDEYGTATATPTRTPSSTFTPSTTPVLVF